MCALNIMREKEKEKEWLVVLLYYLYYYLYYYHFKKKKKIIHELGIFIFEELSENDFIMFH